MTDIKFVGADAIAEFFIEKANQSGKVITNKKIQKLLYYAQAWSVVINKKPLFEERIEAWVHGPAIRSIYVKYKEFGFSPIKKDTDIELISLISTEDKKLLEDVWTVYGKYDSAYLEMLTHSEKPWQDARAGLEASENSEQEITIESMAEFYSKVLEENKARVA